MKFLSFICAGAICLSLVACGPRKPAYEDVNPQSTKADAANHAAQSGEAAPAAANNSQPPPAVLPAPAPTAQADKFKPPTFMDMNKGEAKDLPNYPNAVRMNIQYGPMSGQSTLSLSLHTTDSMDKIAEYYERIIKSNGWKVTNKTRDVEFSEWDLKKGEQDEARVEVRKPPQGGGLFIAISRVEKPAPPKQ